MKTFNSQTGEYGQELVNSTPSVPVSPGSGKMDSAAVYMILEEIKNELKKALSSAKESASLDPKALLETISNAIADNFKEIHLEVKTNAIDPNKLPKPIDHTEVVQNLQKPCEATMPKLKPNLKRQRQKWRQPPKQ